MTTAEAGMAAGRPVTNDKSVPPVAQLQPTTETPPRRPGSVRRTTTLDMIGASLPSGEVHLHGLGRDLSTHQDGLALSVDEAVLDLVVQRGDSTVVRSLETAPHHDRLEQLLGQSALSGFRDATREVLAKAGQYENTLRQLLDDAPVGIIISRYPLAGSLYGSSGTHAPRIGICSGWRDGGTMVVGIQQRGALPSLSKVMAPSVIDYGKDALTWHAVPALAPGDVRRMRRMDVGRADEEIWIDAMFRDSYQDGPDRTVAIHEYTLTATVRAEDLVLRELAVEARALPWPECPAALASAASVRGHRLGTLRNHVRSTLTGTSTCTHLNDLLRSLDGVASMVGHLPS